jgi:hypothetical protein
VVAPTASGAAEGSQASLQHAETCVQTDTDAEQSATEAGDDSDDLFVRSPL